MLQTIHFNNRSRSAVNVYRSPNNRVQKMENTLKIWHAIMASITFFISIVGAVVVFSNKVENQRLRIEYLESSDKDKALQIKDLNQRQDSQFKEINNKLTDILIMLQNKENKKQ
jgi:hypothetical protein